MNKARLKAFPPIVTPNAKVLILGSMPSAASLADHQYYAHPRNHFWLIMSILFGSDIKPCYAARCHDLSKYRIALWDVIAGCIRRGSLDSNIIEESIVVNDFSAFFERYTKIHSVFFNGGKAEQVYRKHVLHTLAADLNLEYHRLPSSSPANATWSLAEKLEAWQTVKQKADIIS